MNNFVERFLKYVKIDTDSDPSSNVCPSSDIQLNLAKVIVEDLKELGLEEISLDENGYVNTPIMAYSAKYSSNYYGPFREAADSAPSFGDRKSYQMDFRNSKEYFREVEADIEEGADFIMVKPALAYLDVINAVSNISLPIVAYNVSGEYSMVKAASQNGWIDEKGIVMENMFAMKRAGVNIIITYHAKDIAKWYKNKEVIF